jgi:Cu/Ag efflux pump CusA
MKFRLLILAAAIGLMAFGIVQLRDARLDVLPEFSPPYAEVQTEALGLSAEEVEQLITVPLEADLLNGVEGIDVIRSESLPGLSSVVMVFQSGTDIIELGNSSRSAWLRLTRCPTCRNLRRCCSRCPRPIES